MKCRENIEPCKERESWHAAMRSVLLVNGRFCVGMELLQCWSATGVVKVQGWGLVGCRLLLLHRDCRRTHAVASGWVAFAKVICLSRMTTSVLAVAKGLVLGMHVTDTGFSCDLARLSL